MGVVPQKIQDAFEKLKGEYPVRIVLKGIKGKYYVYKESGVWLKELSRTKTISEYLGKITEEGLFVKKALSAKDDLENAKAIIAEHGGEIIWGENEVEKEPVIKEITVKEADLKLLTALSMNGRISISGLAKISGLNQQTAYHRVKALDEKLGIKYLPEIDVGKFGYLQFLVTIKFINKTPPIAKLKEVMMKEPRVQLAAICKGEFDVLIYLLAKDNTEVKMLLVNLREGLSDFESSWQSIPTYEDYGFIPLRNEFLSHMRSEKELLEREFALFYEINKDGKIEFREIDKKYGFDTGRTQYSYHKLKDEGKLRRITISMQKLQLRYVGVILKEVINTKIFTKNRQQSLKDIIDESTKVIDKYVAVYDIMNPDGAMLYVPVFNYEDLDKAVERISSLGLGVKLTTSVITDILVGDFCYRHFDNTYSIQQKILEESYQIAKASRMNYEETGRKKEKEKYRGEIRGSTFTD
jgi:DNA-binding Lrp family transcriptional regulator